MANINDGKQHKPLVFTGDTEALFQRAFEAEDGYVSVGGLAHELGMLAPTTQSVQDRRAVASNEHEFNTLRVALSRFVELSRRRLGLNVAAFADKAGVELDEVLQTEDEDAPAPEPRVVFAIASFLKADANKLMELAGHIQRRDVSLGDAAIKFAAWSQGSEPLSHDEEQILCAFADVVVESTDKD